MPYSVRRVWYLPVLALAAGTCERTTDEPSDEADAEPPTDSSALHPPTAPRVDGDPHADGTGEGAAFGPRVVHDKPGDPTPTAPESR